jgi:saccharopine dehydrogenase (NAD+, L-lysine-forming)
MAFDKIAVLGLGKVGALAARLLDAAEFDVTGIDSRAPDEDVPHRVVQADLTAAEQLSELLTPYQAVLSCLPYVLNRRVAAVAHALGLHYFDLTEDVPTTQAIKQMSSTARGVMAPQCGLAPGFVGIVGANLAAQFSRVRSIRMRVGALPQHPTGLLGYAFNWSPEGVVNEYLNDCEVIEEGTHKWVSPMEWIETIYVNGNKLEAFTTSGGLGTMCETFDGKVENLDYKTMRYPGHVKLMNFFFHELLMREQRELAGNILTHAKPPVDDDVVHLHVSAEGWRDGTLMRREYVRSYYPIDITGKRWRAIAWTTSASVCAVIELVRDGKLPRQGFLKQEQIPFDQFIATATGSLYDKREVQGTPIA